MKIEEFDIYTYEMLLGRFDPSGKYDRPISVAFVEYHYDIGFPGRAMKILIHSGLLQINKVDPRKNLIYDFKDLVYIEPTFWALWIRHSYKTASNDKIKDIIKTYRHKRMNKFHIPFTEEWVVAHVNKRVSTK